jgi:hypothetical protein
MRTALGVGFLTLQIVVVLVSQVSPARWFSWAPHSAQVWYALDVEVDGRTLDAREVAERYGVRQTGWEAHALQNLKDVLIQHTRTYGRGDETTIVLRYRVNGRPVETWTWPGPPDG